MMDEVKLRGVTEYQPQFVMKEFEEPGGCGGCPSIPVKWAAWKKPTAPSSGLRPLGLAPHAPSERLFLKVEEWDSAVPVVDFGDDERW